VRALARDPSAATFREPGIRPFACVLPDTIPREAFAGADLVVHCAYATRHRDLAQAGRINDLGTRLLIGLTREARARFLFISSQSAHETAVSYYGRSKLALEKLLAPASDVAIRPGLVLGGGRAGLFTRMCESLRQSKVIPLFGGGRQPLQTVHIDDLCAAIGTVALRRMTGTYTVAEPVPIPMRGFLELLAVRLGRRPIFVPLPMAPAYAAFRALEAMRIPFPVSSENLLGLRQMRAVDTRRDLERLGVRARPAAESLDVIFPSRNGGSS
jgi:NADH dehydrogenase